MLQRITRLDISTLIFLLFSGLFSRTAIAAESAAECANAILQQSQVNGGLVVHLGCGDGELAAALCVGERYIVQGLDSNAEQIRAARKHLQLKDVYGQVSLRHWDNSRLPYGDNLVNLMVVSDESAIDEVELRRVVAPRGVIVRLNADQSIFDVFQKPVPEDIDQWTHYLHDAGNNAVAEDDRVGPPRHLQWKAGPMWSRSHEFASSVQAMVSANGRLIGIFDEGIIGQPRGVPALWTLIARDAFNGIQLWRLPCDHINPQALTAIGDKVYVTLKSNGPLCVLNAATGETLRTCEASGRVSEIAYSDGRLILATRLPDSDGNVSPHIAVADPDDGHLLWKQQVEAIANNGLVVGEGSICFYNNTELVALSLEDGKELWRTAVSGRSKGYLVLYDGVVFLTGGSTRAFSLETGEALWTGPDGSPHARNPPGLFGANGLIWRAWGDVDPRSFVWQHREEVRNGFDPQTGQVKKTVSAERLVTAGHHIRCYPPKATRRYLMLNKRGVEFFDLQGDNHMRANWTRGACGFGMLPANGFLYTPPSQCFCYQGVLLSGLNALSASRELPQHAAIGDDPTERLQEGPAFETAKATMAKYTPPTVAQWPTYRRDSLRSGSINTSLPVDLNRTWEISLCPPAFPSGDAARPSNETKPAVLLRAVDAAIHGDGAKKIGDAIAAWRGKETYITWKTNIEQAGRYPVWIGQSNQGPGGSVFELTIGEQKLSGKIEHTGSWDRHEWLKVGEVDVAEAGSLEVRITPIEQVDGRLGNVSGVAIGGDQPPVKSTEPPKLREYPRGGLTPPVAADGRVVVAEPDAHAVHAVNADDGSHLWTFTADGRIDSPPTLHKGLCIFGCTDGYVYCLTATDGQLAWRFRAAPEERQICVMGQIESAWPVHGSVLLRDDKIYCTAGRSSHLDGGIYIYALNPASGEIVFETRIQSDEPDVTKFGGRPFDMEGARSDILVGGKEDIYLFQNRFNGSLTPQPMPRVTKLGDRMGEPHLITTDGFLDKTWFNRTYWTHSERWPGYYFTYRGPKSGQILVFDEKNTYALKVYTERRGHSPEFAPGNGYQLIADRNTTKPVLDAMDIGAEKGRGFSRTELPIWAKKLPIRAHGMLLAENRLYVAGPPDLTPEQGAYEAMIGQRGSIFRVVAAEDGASLAEFELKEVPVFDGLIAAGDRLYMATMDGTLVCFGKKD